MQLPAKIVAAQVQLESLCFGEIRSKDFLIFTALLVLCDHKKI